MPSYKFLPESHEAPNGMNDDSDLRAYNKGLRPQGSQSTVDDASFPAPRTS